jgi:transposase
LVYYAYLMATILPVLPSDAATLTSLVEELLSTLVEKERQIGQLSSQIEWLKRQLFGRRSEKLDPNQLALGLGEPPADEPSEPEPAAESETDSPAPRRRGHGRKALPPHLRRERIEYHPSADQLACPECQHERVRIGEETSEQLEYVPASLFVLVHARIKYACRHCQGHVVIGALPGTAPIAKGLPGPGLLAYVTVSKYVDHQPLYRLENSILAREGIELSRSTQCDWMGAGSGLVEPVVKAMKKDLLNSRKIHTDDTTVPVLDRDRQTTKTGHLWTYYGDEEHEHIVFDYTPDHARAGPAAFLAGFEGYLQADAYTGYDKIYAGGKVIEVGCWAHARRKFFEAQSSDGQRSHTAMAFIRRLYEVEKRARTVSAQERHALRLKESAPVLAQLSVWLEENKAAVAPKSPMGKAISYARSHWQALSRYLEDGVLEIDNNAAERALRRVAIGRKNWLFAGSDEGGRRAAIIYSLVASCERLKIDPYEYLRDVLGRISTHPPAEIDQLTPKAWKAARALRAAA